MTRKAHTTILDFPSVRIIPKCIFHKAMLVVSDIPKDSKTDHLCRAQSRTRSHGVLHPCNAGENRMQHYAIMTEVRGYCSMSIARIQTYYTHCPPCTILTPFHTMAMITLLNAGHQAPYTPKLARAKTGYPIRYTAPARPLKATRIPARI